MKKIWDFISCFGNHSSLDPEEARRVQLLARLNFISFLVLVLYMVVEIILQVKAFLPGLALMELCVGIDLFLLYKRKYEFAKHFSVAIITISIGFFILFTPRHSFSEALFVPLSAVPLIIFASRRKAFIYLIVFMLLIPILKYAQTFLTPLVEIEEEQLDIFRLVSIMSAAGVSYFLTHYFKRSNEDFESKLIHMNELVSEKNKEITDSIKYAQHIQKAILPPAQQMEQVFPDSFILYSPKDIVAGDFYWMEQKADRLILAVCDCTGHGVPGAMVSVICSNALNTAVKEFSLTDPGKILDKTRDIVIQTFEKSENEVKDGMDVSLCSFDLKHKELKWAGANNPLWLIRNKEIIEYKPNKQPVGKMDAPAPFTTQNIQLQSGDCIYAFTDGYADQFGGTKGKKFKYSQLKTLLLQNHSLKMSEQLQTISKQLTEWKGDLEQVDDILLVGIKIH